MSANAVDQTLTALQILALIAGGTVPGALTVGGPLNTTGLNNIAASGNLLSQLGSVDVQTAGSGLQVKEGANAKQGTATLVAGAATVANAAVTANSRILLTSNSDNAGTPGFLRVTAKTAATSFVITSSNAADTGIVAYEIFEPG